ncbi:MAG TPA: D-2-hydroxyacid dehydrogenase [Rhodopila sp.]|uniref:D-2-hydroxyacid dehydrogenase n=1 Tax=Rhodopila sp. TaxID=2480087 RepID=UPI002B647FEA|nr:D-2-hydroxyacid dehydrogenase [Rhodopila sp.]HVY17367.1 D-2-hydroxyacid dehydrogenase [Rhodopila sp.]
MHIHLQNPVGDTLFTFDRAMWDAAAARARLSADAHQVTIGTTPNDFTAALPTAEAIVTDTTSIRHVFGRPTPRLKLVFITSAGLDRLAPFDWLPHGVVLMNNRGTHAAKSGEFGIMALLMLANRVPRMVTNQRAGLWKGIWGNVLAGRSVTIVGLGTLGSAVAAHAARFGMVVTGIRANPSPHPDCAQVLGTTALDDVLPVTEFLVLACPLTEATRNIIDRRRLGLLPAGASLLNIGRGGLIDQDALCDALDQDSLSGAVLDVFTPEPIPPGHRLWTTPNLIISPHTSADDPNTYNPRSLDIFLENLCIWQAGGTPPNHFDTVRGY